MIDYSFLDRVLHRLALQVSSIAEMSFDLDQRTVSCDPDKLVNESHVFISGLARAGTTILMRRFHATGIYGSLTYREMPFVLAPVLWNKFMKRFGRRSVAMAERAHGDGIQVDIDSPEALEEVFWRIFTGNQYIKETYLTPHTPDQQIRKNFICYINAILKSKTSNLTRYLSKNNNNILRLNGIRQTFPRALILIPFRDPLSQANSLLNQHNKFLKIHAEDTFSRSYMKWLVHHEFGTDHQPFHFNNNEITPARSSFGTDGLEYWLEIWCKTYSWLLQTAPSDAIFVCYEDLCTDAKVWDRLIEIANIQNIQDSGEEFRSNNSKIESTIDSKLIGSAMRIYNQLVDRSRQALS